jgi:hypothetical protein
MKDVMVRFENWYRLTHWMSPSLDKRDNGEYVSEPVQAMYIAYRAGFNRARKEVKGRLKYEFDCERFRDATGA